MLAKFPTTTKEQTYPQLDFLPKDSNSAFVIKYKQITYSLRQVQELIVLQVEVGYLCAIPNLLRQVLQLVMGHIQSYEVA